MHMTELPPPPDAERKNYRKAPNSNTTWSLGMGIPKKKTWLWLWSVGMKLRKAASFLFGALSRVFLQFEWSFSWVAWWVKPAKRGTFSPAKSPGKARSATLSRWLQLGCKLMVYGCPRVWYHSPVYTYLIDPSRVMILLLYNYYISLFIMIQIHLSFLYTYEYQICLWNSS